MLTQNSTRLSSAFNPKEVILIVARSRVSRVEVIVGGLEACQESRLLNLMLSWFMDGHPTSIQVHLYKFKIKLYKK
jgi:hypothetical protein